MKSLPIVALIGQTNAGKSSLLNRLARQNLAIVAREEGTTRDNVTARIDGRFLLIDTAGLKDPTDSFEAGIQDQIADAIDSAALILLTLDSSKYPDQRDRDIAKQALRLGIKSDQIFRVSATTGQGITALKAAILHAIPTVTAADAEDLLKVALIGRPNVGKSSLFNSLGQKQQALVSSRQGTTRDINRVRVKYHGRTLEILDTAGLRRTGKREVGIEKFSALRTLAAIEEADVCALLVDATEPHAKLDQTLAGQITNAGKGIIVVLTKSDLVTDTDRILGRLEQDFNFLPYAPVLITSSATGQNVTKLFELATEIDATRHLEIKTSDLNKILGEALLEHPPAGLKNTRPKLKYIVQTDTCPPWFVVHGRDLGLLHWSYKRFLERKIREHYPFVGTPICFSFRSDDRE